MTNSALDPASYDPGYGPLVGTRVRIATWNLWGRYGPWEARLPVIVENLRAIDADVLALQEVWEDDTRSQAHELAEALGCAEPVYAANLERDGARSGNAVLARWPILRHSVRVLPRRGALGAVDEEGEERLCVFAEIDGPRGPIQVFCAHLSWRSDHSAVRQEQTRDIAQFLTETRPRPFPAVLCGDLNAEQSSDELRLLTGRSASPVPRVVLRDAWEAAGNRDPGFTWSNTNPFAAASLDVDRRIDHVMVGQPKLGGVGHVLDARVAGDLAVGGMWGSDHLAVVVELRY
ncbi:MAG TPA: endonuclease/exonuclease/phosphatase family protein [Acidimicrobiia bacterium]|nr:endonuclease/exonuclease/phosphatase family protein [Acidimicrobiia bacterium]